MKNIAILKRLQCGGNTWLLQAHGKQISITGIVRKVYKKLRIGHENKTGLEKTMPNKTPISYHI